MAALLDNVPTPIVVLFLALLILGSIAGYGGRSRFGYRPALFGNTRNAIFHYGGYGGYGGSNDPPDVSGGNESGFFESSSLPGDRLF